MDIYAAIKKVINYYMVKQASAPTLLADETSLWVNNVATPELKFSRKNGASAQTDHSVVRGKAGVDIAIEIDTVGDAAATVVIPVTGTLSTLAGAETLTNKTITTDGASECVFGSATASKGTMDVLLSGSTSGKKITLSSSHTDNRTIVIPDTSDTLVTLAATQALTNKKHTGGAASTSNEWTLPAAAGQAGLSSTTGNIMFDSTAGVNKAKLYDGTSWKTVGGGIQPVAATISANAFTAVAGNAYTVDWAGATNVNTDVTVTFPTAVAGDALEFITIGNNAGTGRLLMKPAAGQTITVLGVSYASTDTVKLLPCDPAWVKMSWNGTAWIPEGQATFVSGTFAGNLAVTGQLTTTTGTDSTSSATGDLQVAGGVGIGKSLVIGTTSTTTGITLKNNTASYTPTVLNYYEEGSFTASFNQGMGVNPNTATVTVYFTRIGKIVTLRFPQTFVTANATDVYWLAPGAIPTRLRPTASFNNACIVMNNNTPMGGRLAVDTNGDTYFIKNYSGADQNWTIGTTYCGFYSQYITYSIQ